MLDNEKYRKIGIWMDHSHAHLIEYSDDHIDSKSINIKTSFNNARNKGTDQNESMMHNKEQNHQAEYYRKIGDKITDYNVVLLFGPTEAKTELLHFLKADHHFEHIKFEVKTSDKMTKNQENAFVNDYFLTYKMEG